MKKICIKCKELKEIHCKELCNKCYNKNFYLKNKEKINKRNEENYQKNREEYLKQAKKYKLKRKIKALEMVGRGKIECVNCGCKDIRTLNINHINGNGRKDNNHIKGNIDFYSRILNGKRKIDDLNLLCQVCNWAYFIKQKYGIEYNIELKPIKIILYQKVKI